MTTLILLAAGRGTRLGILTEEIPKCLNNFRGRTLLEHIFERAREVSVGFDEIIIVGGYKWEHLLQFGHTVLINSDWSTTGPFGTLETADSHLSKKNCVVSYTDIFFSTNFLESCLESDQDIFIPSNKSFLESWGGRQIEILSDLESFKVESEMVTEIGMRVERIEEVQGQFAGLLRLTPAGWTSLKECATEQVRKKSDITWMLQKAIENNVKLGTKQVLGFWKEFDEVSDFA